MKEEFANAKTLVSNKNGRTESRHGRNVRGLRNLRCLTVQRLRRVMKSSIDGLSGLLRTILLMGFQDFCGLNVVPYTLIGVGRNVKRIM